MAETQEQALKRARKLLALGTSSNEHEAANALAAAQRIIDDWRLEQALLEQDSEEEPQSEEPIHAWDEPLDTPKQRVTWKGRLALSLAEANACQVYWGATRTQRALNVIGRNSDVATVRYLYAYCVREIDRLARRHNGRGRTWLNNYRLGCVDAVSFKLREMQRTRRKQLEAGGDGVSLARVNKALARLDDRSREVAQWVADNMNLRAGGSSRHRLDMGARATGRRDGSSIHLGGGAGLPQGGGGVRGLLGH